MLAILSAALNLGLNLNLYLRKDYMATPPFHTRKYFHILCFELHNDNTYTF